MEKLILLHGSLSNAKEFEKIVPYLEKEYEVFPLEIPHHGIMQESGIPFEINALVDYLLDFLQKTGPSYLYGHSLGGYMAVVAAIRDEINIKGIVTQGTKWLWNEKIASDDVKRLLKTPETKGEIAFDKYLQELHGSYYSQLKEKTAISTITLGKSPLISLENVKNITIPVRMTIGGRDVIASSKDTKQLCDNIPNGHYFEIPSMIHPIAFIQPKFVAYNILNQLKSMHYQWVKTPNGKMTYQTFGDIQNDRQPVLLFLHEALGSIAQWQDFPEKCCATLHLPGIALELPGYAFSEHINEVRNEKYLHHFATQYIPDFISSIDLKNPLILVGHSDGGTEALLFSAQFPEKVKAQITMAAHFMNEKETRQGIHSAINAYRNKKLVGLEYFQGLNTDYIFHAWCNTWLLPEFENWNISKEIKNDKTPSLILQGVDDQYGTLDQVKGISKCLKNVSTHIIEKAGHHPHLENQEETLRIIQKWFLEAVV